MNEQKVVWVTGASSGLGLHTALAYRDAGWKVIAGARSFIDIRGEDDGMVKLPLDVTDEDSIHDFVTEAGKYTDHVDVLVQCAGMLVLGSCEETSVSEFEKVIMTNYLGMVRVNRQVLPVMRRQGNGRIVLFSSINGLMGIPFQSAYTASKHAIEGYAECLQMEVKPFNIEVMLVEPGDHRSGSEKYRPKAAAMNEESPYFDEYRSAVQQIHHDESNGSDPDHLGKCIVKATGRKKMPYRLRVASPDQHLAVWIHKFLPARLNAGILRKYYIRKKD